MSLKKLNLKGEEVQPGEEHLQAMDVATFVAWRDLFLRGEDKQISIVEYKCHVLLLALRDGTGTPLLYKFTDEEYPDDAPLDEVLDGINPKDYFKAWKRYFRTQTRERIEELYNIYRFQIQDISPEVELLLGKD